MEKFLNLIFIPQCAFCKSYGSTFCAECLAKCKRLNQILSVEKTNVKVLFAYEYQGLIRECIRSAKYRNKHFSALKVLAREVALDLAPKIKRIIKNENCVFVPIPVSKAKLKSRGFNQAEIISKIFSKALKVVSNPGILSRSKETTSQYTNSRNERFKNMEGAFEVKNDVKDKFVLLVDDICTTGATFIEASKVLYKAGAKQVLCVSLARKSLVKST